MPSTPAVARNLLSGEKAAALTDWRTRCEPDAEEPSHGSLSKRRPAVSTVARIAPSGEIAMDVVKTPLLPAIRLGGLSWRAGWGFASQTNPIAVTENRRTR
jgi:hypothetical protein